MVTSNSELTRLTLPLAVCPGSPNGDWHRWEITENPHEKMGQIVIARCVNGCDQTISLRITPRLFEKPLENQNTFSFAARPNGLGKTAAAAA